MQPASHESFPSPDIGPSSEDIADYNKLVERLRDGEEFPFDPRSNAEFTASSIDNCRLGLYTSRPSNETRGGLADYDRLKIAQQRYIAGILGLNVGPLAVDSKTYITSSNVALPEGPELPPPPTNDELKKMSPVLADIIYAAHYLAAHRQAFEKQGAFEKIFVDIASELREHGTLTVPNDAQDTFDRRAGMSFMRQVARALGYKVGVYSKNSEGSYELEIKGLRAGFDKKDTAFSGRKRYAGIHRKIGSAAVQGK